MQDLAVGEFGSRAEFKICRSSIECKWFSVNGLGEMERERFGEANLPMAV